MAMRFVIVEVIALLPRISLALGKMALGGPENFNRITQNGPLKLKKW